MEQMVQEESFACATEITISCFQASGILLI